MALLFALFSFTSCNDNGCIFADDFGGSYLTIESNPEAVFGNYPNQSTNWIDAGVRSSGGPIEIAITGAWVPWSMMASSQATLTALRSCLATKSWSNKNYGLCAKRVPVDPSTNTLLTGDARVVNLNAQNCICYEDEEPKYINGRSGTPTATEQGQPGVSTCNTLPRNNGKPATEGQCVIHYTLSDKLKAFTRIPPSSAARPNDIPGEPRIRASDNQGNVCKFEKGMGLYMGLFGSNGNRQPLRSYHLFSQEERCPVTRNSAGECVQNVAGVMIDRTQYVYRTSAIPVYDDKSGNNCTDDDSSDDEPHRMREVIKLKIHDSYYRDNYGSYRVEFLSGVYSGDQVLVIEYIVNLIEEVLLGRLDITTGERTGGILIFLYNAIVGNPSFVLIVQLTLVLYIAFLGVSVLMGVVELSRKEIFTKILQIGLIFMFASTNGWEMYNRFFVSFFKYSMDEVVNRISGFANTFFLEGENTSNIIRNAQLRSNNPDAMGAKFAYMDLVIRMLFSEAVTKKIWSLFFYSIFGLLYIVAIYGIIFYFLFTMGIVAFVYCVTLTKMIIGLALGPIFILFMLFKKTNEYFKKWITFLAARSLETVILFLLVFIFISLIDRKFNELLYYQACIEEWNLWLFKLKFMVANNVYSISPSGQATQNARGLVDWFLMLTSLFLIIYMTKMIIMQIPDLAGKIISVGGEGNQSGSGTSFAASGFRMAQSVVGEAFEKAGGAAYRGATGAGGLLFRGAREGLSHTQVGRAVGSGLDMVGRARIRNSIIDKSIEKAMGEASKKGLASAEREEFVRNKVMNEIYDKNSRKTGLRGWASKNSNTAAALNINTDTIQARLDKAFLDDPMKKAMKETADKLKSEGVVGNELKSRLEDAALKWASQNSSSDKSSQIDAMERLKGRRGFAGAKGGWRPRRVNFFDEMAKMDYKEASKGKNFGDSDEKKEEYLSYLKSRQFEKLQKNPEKYDEKKMEESSKVTDQSRGFIRRAHDRKNLFNKDRISFSRNRRNKELKELEYNAVRDSLLGKEFSNEKAKIDAKLQDKDSIEGQRAEYYGEMYQRQRAEKMAKEKEKVDKKQQYFMTSLAGKLDKQVKGQITALGEDADAKAALNNSIVAAHKETIGKFSDGVKNGKIDIKDPNAKLGLVSFPLEKPLKIGDKEFTELSVFEAKKLMEGAAISPTGDGREIKEDKLLKEQKEQKELLDAKQEEDKLLEKQKELLDAKCLEEGAAEKALKEKDEALEKLQKELKESGNEGLANSIEAKRDEILGIDNEKVTAALNNYDEALKNNNELQQEVQNVKVIADKLEVEFGKSITDAFSIGIDGNLMKASDLSVGGAKGESGNDLDYAALSGAQMSLAQAEFKVKVNKNKMAYLEHEKTSLEKQAKSAEDPRERSELQGKVKSLEGEISSLNHENTMESSRISTMQNTIKSLGG